MTACAAMSGGRKRRGTRSRKMKGGNMYSFGYDPLTGTGGGGATAVPNLPVDSATGKVSNVDYTQAGGRRRRHTRKGGRKSRRSTRRRRTMRGGASWYSSSNAGGSFTGSGTGGMINLTQYPVNRPAGGPVENADGAMRTSA